MTTLYHDRTGTHVGGFQHPMEHNLTISKGGLISPESHTPSRNSGNAVDGYHYRGTERIKAN